MMKYFTGISADRPVISMLLGWLFFLGVLLLPVYQPVLLAETCDYDYNIDGDTDGRDLYVFLQEFDSLYTMEFAADFGSDTCGVECKDLLPCSVDEANSCFAAAVQATNDPVDRTYHSLTRILALIYDPAINSLLTDLGMEEEVRTFCNWTAGWILDSEGEPVLPETLPSSGSVFRLLIDTLLPEIEGALDELSGIDSSIAEPFIVLCEEFQSPGETGSCENIEMDYGDIALYRALLYFLKAFVLVIDAYDLNIEEIAEFIQALKGDVFVINDYLCDDDPSTSTCLSQTLLTPKVNAPALLADAKTAFRNAIDSYMEASAFIRNETDDQEDDLIAMPEDANEIADEAEFRSVLSDIRDSLGGPTVVGEGTDTVDNPFELDLTWFFDQPFNLRDNMPLFTDNNEPICGSFDPRLGGILPEFDNDFWANGMGMMVSVTGDVSCGDGLACGEIWVGAFLWDWYSDSLGQLIESVSISSPGAYEIPIWADKENVTVAAYWDKDADGMLSPGDFAGRYPFGAFDVESVNCAGPENIDVVISNEVIGIKGQITCEGQPVPNIRVSLHEGPCQNSISSAVTDENGYYVLTSSSTASAYIYVNPDKYVGGWWNGSAVARDCNQAAAFNPSTGQTIVNMVVEQADSISGVIQDAYGNPIPWVNVQAWNYDGSVGSWIQSSFSNEVGVYILYLNQQPYAGSCVVKAEDYNNNYIDEYYDNRRTSADANPIVVDPVPGVHHVSGIDFQLDRGGQISGVVTEDSSGSPISGMSVNAYDYNTSDWLSGTSTQEDGSYVISGLPTGSYRISISPNNTGYLWEYYDDVRDYSSATAVSATEGQMVSGINFELEEGGSISGRVTRTSDGQPLEDVYVYAYDASTGSYSGDAYTDSNGDYTVTDLPAGSYQMTASPSSGGYLDEYYDDVRDAASATAVNVTAAQNISGIDFSLESGATISGTVIRSSDSQPLENMRMMAYAYDAGTNTNNYIRSAYTGANGAYAFEGLSAGSYKIRAYDNDGNYWGEYYENAFDLSSATVIEVVLGQTVSSINFSLDLTGGVSGTVTRASDNLSLEGIWVWVYDISSGNYVAGGQTDVNGEYLIPGIPAGSYRLIANGNTSDGLMYQYYDHVTDHTLITPVNVNAGQTRANVNFALDAQP